MMTVVVQKFGGSSLADLEKLGSVAKLVMETQRAGHAVCVVVSAMGKTTDGLLALASQAASGGGAALAEPPRRELDMLVSTGERVSMALLSIAIRARGGDAVSLTGSQSGIITNDRHFDARIIEIRPFRIEDELARGRVVIVAGYQGMSYRREITTLGRGGSDTTAVALAAALRAERCEIYSDVDGVYSADPRHVAGARHLPVVDVDTMQAMSDAGAKVLGARAVEWAKRERIVIHARKTSDFASGERGSETRIVPSELGAPEVRAVTGARSLALVRVARSRLAAVLRAATAAEIELLELSLDGESAAALVSLVNVPDSARVAAELARAANGGGFAYASGLGMVSLFGSGVGADPSAVERALELLESEPVRVFATPNRLSAVLSERELERAQNSWHEAFVARAAPAVSRHGALRALA